MQYNIKCSRNNVASIAETLGNWDFCNKISNSGQELRRLRCLFNQMDCLKTRKPMMSIKYNCLYDPKAWYIKPSPEENKPIWTVPMRRPLITYSSTADVIMTANLNNIGSDLLYPIPGRSYLLQGKESCNTDQVLSFIISWVRIGKKRYFKNVFVIT